MIDMRFIESEKVRKLGEEVDPYLIFGIDGVTFKEGTPDEIKKKHELWKKLYSEESKLAEEICY